MQPLTKDLASVLTGAVTSTTSSSWQKREPYYNYQWSLFNNGQYNGSRVDADIDADAVFSKTPYPSFLMDPAAVGQNTIAILDTGVNWNHVDLNERLNMNANFISREPIDGIDNDGNGYVDDPLGWNFMNNGNSPFDDQGHGSHVSGLAAASANAQGIVGTNPNASIIPVKVLGPNGGTTPGVVAGINYAVSRGAKIINMSLGGPGYSQAMYAAIANANNAGALVVAAAGNDFVNTDYNPSYPAAYNLPNIISVAASDYTDWFANFSNYGKATVDLLAPGKLMLSDSHIGSTGLVEKSGTSMAAPIVAGAVSYFWSRNPTWTALQVKDRLLNIGVDKIPGAENYTVSGGRLNMAHLMGWPATDVYTSSGQDADTLAGMDLSTNADPVINYVPFIDSKNLSTFNVDEVTDAVIGIVDGDALSDRIARMKEFLTSTNIGEVYADQFDDFEILDSLGTSLTTIDFKDHISNEGKRKLMGEFIARGWFEGFEMNSEVSLF
ncbi:Hypothetical protein P9303_11721 [Prochlorococcus marinus str. MIT 9303]|uniref:Peptidase S8/S53 domain-containing protein n=2 Tax=Prochlorococcus marinus TaxID=1219 RepID=A2C8W1_PROM3|nr:Hypothetical protein P9303_11721 [Prochlorococcus marinus str. MIT 9303]